MTQVWHDLLFAHWPIPAETLRAHVPSELELDTFDGTAWIGIVPFRMSGVRLRGLPGLPGTTAFPELNARTYVRLADRPGVWFFSLDAASWPAVKIARAWFHLPYFRARMRCQSRGESIEYACRRDHAGANPAEWRGTYAPTGPVEHAKRGTLEHWLTERYCLYARSAAGRVRRGEIHHDPWPLQPATARIEIDTIAAAHGIARPDCAPHLRFARRLDVRIWAPRSVSRG
jgi:uncharacterized protein YqjF (DUF2071 family)